MTNFFEFLGVMKLPIYDNKSPMKPLGEMSLAQKRKTHHDPGLTKNAYHTIFFDENTLAILFHTISLCKSKCV